MKGLLSLLFCFTYLLSNGQSIVKLKGDTLLGTGQEIVVTANRSERKLSNVAVPTQLISKLLIARTGSVKLQDILQEQTGLVIVNSALGTSLIGYPSPFGQGVQMLGLDPAYTAILLDGEPLIGRNAGILKLGRLATGNIKQIEIVKGPASSLYGSEAMAGVINILTENPSQEEWAVQVNGASNQTLGTSLSYKNKFNKTGLQFFINRYRSDGYDLDPNLFGKTIDPFREWNGQLKITQPLSAKWQFLASLRNFDSKQTNQYQINWQGGTAVASGHTLEQDKSAFVQLKWTPTQQARLYLRTYFDRYQNHSFVNEEKSGQRFDETSFDQSLLKPEFQYEKSRPGKSYYVAGMGAAFETIEASRYSGLQRLSTKYFFTQKEWYAWQEKLTLIAGARIDKRTDFNASINPRLALAYKPNSVWKFTASIGKGFKAPDFRHMYLNFFNTQIGYSLLGNTTIGGELEKLANQGLLSAGANIAPYQNLPSLKPERSVGFHLGAKYAKGLWNWEASVYRNDIQDLIDVFALPFTRSNGFQIYSYHNLGKVFTQGFETDIKYRVYSKFTIQAGYQFLMAKDKSIIKQIEEGKIFKRDPITYQTSLVTQKDYVGLPNRSKHTANLKFLYENLAKGFDAYIRGVFRGRFGLSDNNGNAIIDDPSELADGMMMVNIASSKSIGKGLHLQLGVENLLNQTNPIQLPNIPGRIYFINLHVQFTKN